MLGIYSNILILFMKIRAFTNIHTHKKQGVLEVIGLVYVLGQENQQQTETLLCSQNIVSVWRWWMQNQILERRRLNMINMRF